ncbi:membrane protein [Planctomycetota bacterium]|nr:membrane protein [Planctomycetota bacterium]
MTLLAQAAWILAFASLLMVVLWELQRRLKDAALVDAGWALALGASAVFVAASGTGHPLNRLLIAVLGGLWGLRLGLHLLHDRVLSTAGEDGRYQAMRRAMGSRAQLGFFGFFQLQAAAVAVLAMPFALVAANPVWSWPLAIAAITLWLVSIIGEAVADRQLADFRKDPAMRGQVCQIGLWRYSRHPNYFFEWLHWWAYAVVAAGNPAWWGWLGFAAPPLMLVLLLKVSGIPFTEQQALRSRGAAYARYQRTTSAFFPWFPRPEAP